jgi:16S rRNA (guanine527-N7)-methyltransferase
MFMPAEKADFIRFLKELALPDQDSVVTGFEAYHSLLLEYNAVINLFSRATPEEELWTKHFLDSLLPLKCVDFNGKKVLDFGSGGGLPGIPVKLAIPGCRMTLLDSIRKKASAMAEMVAGLQLADCDVIAARLEDLPPLAAYDIVLCRAVKMEERYLAPLWKLLKPDGQVLFYKAQSLEDIARLQPRELIRRDFSFGIRAIYAVQRASLK